MRLRWGSSPPPLELTPSRCACAALVTPADWSVLFGYQFRTPDHTNVLELTALTSLVRHLANRRARRQRILCCVDSRVVLGAVSKGRSSSRRLNLGLRRLAFECPSASPSIDLLRVPSWGTLPTHHRGVPRSPASDVRSRHGHPEAPTVHFGSAAVARELKLLREHLPRAAVRALHFFDSLGSRNTRHFCSHSTSRSRKLHSTSGR